MKSLKKKRKKGFTLIEMVAVVAIIGILAAILVPKITGYMKEAKKTGVVDQARKVVQAYETYSMKDKTGTVTPAANITVGKIDNPTMLSLLDVADKDAAKAMLDKLPSGTTVEQCKTIVEGKTEFTVTTNGILEKLGGTPVATK